MLMLMAVVFSLGNSNTIAIDENKDVNLYDKFSVLICGILDNEVYSQYLHENNIKSLDITQNQVYGRKYQSHVLCLTNNINKENNDADYDCNQFNYVLYCIDKQSRVESYNRIGTRDTIIIAINQSIIYLAIQSSIDTACCIDAILCDTQVICNVCYLCYYIVFIFVIFWVSQ